MWRHGHGHNAVHYKTIAINLLAACFHSMRWDFLLLLLHTRPLKILLVFIWSIVLCFNCFSLTVSPHAGSRPVVHVLFSYGILILFNLILIYVLSIYLSICLCRKMSQSHRKPGLSERQWPWLWEQWLPKLLPATVIIVAIFSLLLCEPGAPRSHTDTHARANPTFSMAP